LLAASVLGLGSFWMAGTASAIPVTLDFTGTVTSVDAILANVKFTADIPALGNPPLNLVSGVLSYASGTPEDEDPATPNPAYGLYPGAVTALTGTIGDFGFALNPAGQTAIEVMFDATGDADQIKISADVVGALLSLTSGQEATVGRLEIVFRGAGCASSDALPALFPSLGGCFSIATETFLRFSIGFEGTLGEGDGHFSIDTLSQRPASVPEPMTPALVAAALLAAAAVRMARARR
jgi:hypothetical protein